MTFKAFVTAALTAASIIAAPLALAAGGDGGPASTLQISKKTKGGPSHSNLRVPQGTVTFQIGYDGVNYSNVIVRVSNGKRVFAEVPLAKLTGVENFSWTAPAGLATGTYLATWQGTVSAVSAGAAEKGIKDKGIKGCETC
jgi:hypothetical protein